MKSCIIYSSVTGNTRKVAEALAAASGAPCFPVREAPDPDDYDLLALGFWVRLGQADARTQGYMRRVLGKKVFFFRNPGSLAGFAACPALRGRRAGPAGRGRQYGAGRLPVPRPGRSENSGNFAAKRPPSHDAGTPRPAGGGRPPSRCGGSGGSRAALAAVPCGLIACRAGAFQV